MIPSHPSIARFHSCGTVVVGLAAMILVVLIPAPSWSQNPFPAKISGIKMGDSMASVIKMVKDSGSYEATPGDEIRRPSLRWNLPNNPYYKEMSFTFTEKNRLYLIHFDLKKISRSDLRAMKKWLFDKYGISWDDPWKLKSKGKDVLLYGPPEMGRVYYFEFSDPKTGEKAFELLDRITSAEDRPKKKSSDDAKGTDSGAVTQGATSGEDQSKQAAGPIPAKKIEPDTKEPPQAR